MLSILWCRYEYFTLLIRPAAILLAKTEDTMKMYSNEPKTGYDGPYCGETISPVSIPIQLDMHLHHPSTKPDDAFPTYKGISYTGLIF